MQDKDDQEELEELGRFLVELAKRLRAEDEKGKCA